MAGIDDLRKQYKGSIYDSMTDYEIAEHVAKNNNVPVDYVEYQLGIPSRNKAGLGTAFKNSLYSTAQGIGQFGGDFLPGVDNNNALELYGREGTERNPITVLDGSGSALSNLGSNLSNDPLNTVGQIAGGALGFMMPVGAAKAGLSGYRAVRGLGEASKMARLAGETGEAAAYGIPSYGQMRDQQEQAGQNSGLDKLKALTAAMAIGKIETGYGPEALLREGANASTSLGRTTLKQAAGEAGEEILQAPIQQWGSNQDVMSQDTLDQMLAGGAVGALAGGLSGPVHHYMGKKPIADNAPTDLLNPAAQEPSDDIRFVQTSPDAMVRQWASNNDPSIFTVDEPRPVAAWQQNAPKVDPNEPISLVETNGRFGGLLPQSISSGQTISFPDGSVGTQEQLDAYLASLPEEQRVPARAALLGYGEQAGDKRNLEPTQNTGSPNPLYATDDGVVMNRPLTPDESFARQALADKTAQEQQAAAQSNAVVDLYNNVIGTGYKSLNFKKMQIASQVLDLMDDGNATVEDAMHILGPMEKGAYGRSEKRLQELQQATAAKAGSPTQSQVPVVPDTQIQAPAVVSALKELITPAQASWWEARSNPDNEGKSDAALAKELGFSRQNASKLQANTKDKLVASLSKKLGLTPEQVNAQISSYLQQNKGVQEAYQDTTGMSPAEQPSTVDERDLIAGEDGTANLTTRDSVNDANIAIGKKVDVPDTPDPVYEARVKEAMARHAEFKKAILAHPYAALATEDWDDMKSDSAPSAAELPEEIAVNWIATYIEFKEGVITNEQLEREQRDLEDEADRYSSRTTGLVQGTDRLGSTDVAKRPAVEREGNTDSESQRAQELEDLTKSQANDARLEARQSKEVAPVEEEVEPETANDTTPKPRSAAEMLEALSQYRTDPIARSYIEEMRTGRGNEAEINGWLDAKEADTNPTKYSKKGTDDYVPTTVAKIRSTLAKYFLSGSKFNSLVTIVQNLNEIPAAVLKRNKVPSTDTAIQAFVSYDGHVYMVASNIQEGNEVAVFMHEVGVHVGLEKMIGGARMRALAKQVADWALANDDSIESKLAARVVRRVQSAAKNGGLNMDNESVVTEEYIAYFIEEAVNAGINPTAMEPGMSAGIKAWFKEVLTALMKALANIGIRDTSKVTAQDLVNLAYGAANIELSRQDVPIRPSPYLRMSVDVRPEVRDWTKQVVYGIKNVTPKWLTGTQLEEQWGKAVPSLTTHQDILNKMAAEETHLRTQAQKVLEKWGTFAFKAKALNERLMNVMYDATRLAIHPDLAFTDKENGHLTEKDLQDYLSLKAKYDALSPEAKAIYQEARQTLADLWQKRKDIYAELVGSSYQKQIDEAKKANDTAQVKKLEAKRDKELDEHDKQIKSLKGPYFPQMRFGDYILVAESPEIQRAREALDGSTGDKRKEAEKRVAELEKSDKHYIVEAFESRVDLDKRKPELEAKGMDVREKKAEEYSREFRPVTAGAVDKINTMLENQFDGDTSRKLKALITEMYIASTPEKHALQRQIKRKGVAGASTDMLRAFAETVERDAHYLSRLKYTKDLSSNLYTMSQETKAKGIDEQNVYNTVMARTEADYDYAPTPLLSWLVRASSMFHLGISPAYLLTNMTQPWFITLPQIAGTHGFGKSAAAMRTAWADSVRLIKQAKGGGIANLAEVDFSSVKNPQERELLLRLKDLNKLDANILLDMANIADGISPKMLKLQKAFGWATHHIELVNRISTALATYRLEQAKNPNLSSKELIDRAIQMVDLTQLDYSATNTALLMKPTAGLGSLNKVIFQFRKYQQGMLYLLGRNAKLAFSGDKEAKKALGYLMATQVMFAGLSGLPLTAPLLLALNGLFDDDDEDGDAETQMRNFLADTIGEDAARAFYKGLPNAFGIDLSNNVGMGNLLSPLPMMHARDVTDARTGKDAVSNVLFNAAGAPVGMTADVLDGAMQMWSEGEIYKGLGRAAPRFIGSVAKAADLAENGLTTRTGNQVMSPDQFDGWDLAMRAAGFTPTSVSEHYSAQQAKEDTTNEIGQMRKQLLSGYARAVTTGDDPSTFMEKIQAFNEKHPSNMITRSAMIKSTQVHNQMEQQTDEAGVRFNKNEQGLKEIDRFAK